MTIDDDATMPREPPPKETIHATWTEAGRFPPGTLLAERYRVVGRLGRGGMGEVYRADDLKLGQSVALKFLPEAVALDGAWLRRLHDEVRIARELAHPNVCRVYDIAEIEGEHFITMEYVDGEDLSSLLRRIGRLPKDKAVEIARQLCAGIAAAHDRGVLHRDLKPANIMLDGRGHVRITDFGIAALAGKLDGDEIRAGTPAYMAPEQLAGKSVTRRSDIYSLGLVLYEIFTGREAFTAQSAAQLERMRQSGPPTTPSTYIDDMDPIVERVIMRCLENEPQDRPGSAIAVAAALPGGDPLAQALAAGETPSPEMIAESGAKGGLAPGVAVACLACFVILAAAAIVIMGRVVLFSMVPLDRPPEALADLAGRIAADLGYAEAPAGRAWNFERLDEYLDHIKDTDRSRHRWDRLAAGRPAAVRFWYRSAPQAMPTWTPNGRVWWNNPALAVPEMIRIAMDTQGRLLRFEAVPPALAEAVADPPKPDWSSLFAAADLDEASFEPATPTWTPAVYCDTRAAWIGGYPDIPDTQLRIEAAALDGKPVSFRLIDPWQKPAGTTESIRPEERVEATIFITLFVLIPLAGGALVWRHLRAGRGDRKGAARLALYVFAIMMGQWLFTADHVLAPAEVFMLTMAFGRACGVAVVAWILYLAVEPYARRHWPHALVAWTRLLAGRVRDPMVGRDILLGCLAGAAIPLIVHLTITLIGLYTAPPVPPGDSTNMLLGGRYAVGAFITAQSDISLFIGLFVLLLILRMLLRRPWAANLAFMAIFFAFFSSLNTSEPGWPLWWVASALIPAVLLLTIVRFGLLSLVVMAFVASLFFNAPLTLELDRFYAFTALAAPLAALLLAAYGFWISLAGRPIFRDALGQ